MFSLKVWHCHIFVVLRGIALLVGDNCILPRSRWLYVARPPCVPLFTVLPPHDWIIKPSFLQECKAPNSSILSCLLPSKDWELTRRGGEQGSNNVLAWSTAYWCRAHTGSDSLSKLLQKTPDRAVLREHGEMVQEESDELRYAVALLKSVVNGCGLLAATFHGQRNPKSGKELPYINQLNNAKAFIRATGTLADYHGVPGLIFGDWNTDFTRHPGLTEFRVSSASGQDMSPAIDAQVGGYVICYRSGAALAIWTSCRSHGQYYLLYMSAGVPSPTVLPFATRNARQESQKPPSPN